ncbi:hypothetical protein DEU56DRAFT_283837 [Suillus clintonianus]|uniref:uncharacterized protein n=1 Tax=Suillus clintonianus TaxID=1904413 RepID=UPI001B87B3E6|nr:uncharacterized protein DEU56DRAFT_283837 [Suillus clintonianus]KAG2141103.1 hypothetical protein DEU56DRAFT_283837 [Suillus clintonianus]
MASIFLPLDTAVLISSAVVGILYGFSALMFIGTIWAFTYKRRMRDINWPMAAIATLMFLLSTVHMVPVIIHAENGLVKYRDTFPGGPDAFFADISQDQSIRNLKDVIYILQTLIGDGVVIYRCYIVWQSVWVIILPCMMWCGIGVSGIFWVYSNPTNGFSTFAGEAGIWLLTFLAFTLATNLFSSGLVAYRIWTIERKVSTVRVTKRKIPILRVLVDAAILYSVALCLVIAVLAFLPGISIFMGELLVPIISIAFYMVFIRIAINKHTQDGGTSETNRRTPFQLRMQHSQTGYRQNDMSFWPTAQK